MGFYNKITGADITAQIEAYNKEIQALPVDYQQAWVSIGAKLMVYSDFTGRNLLPLYKHTMELLVDMASQEKSIEEVFGDNINDYCQELTEGMMSNAVRAKWRDKLNSNIEKKLGK
ncbi:DUF1048 domain-containing protein [Mollicutes bacterium LVI A0039]|nr:DUF1048 domain-containing protein [Mollicutes bacterium LVI A0039]